MSIGYSTNLTIILTAAAGTTPIIPIAGFNHGALQFPTTATAVTLTFWVSDDGVTFMQAYDQAGVAIGATVAASRGVRIPTDLFVHRYLRIVPNAVPATGAEVRISLGY